MRADREPSKANLIKSFGGLIKSVITNCPSNPADMSDWIACVEGTFDMYEVPDEIRHALLMPYLNDKGRRLVAKMDCESKQDFEKFKSLLQKEFRLTSMQHLHAFQTAVRKRAESYLQYVTRVETLLKYYLTSRQVTENYDDLCNLLVSDHVKGTLNDDLRAHVINLEQDEWFKPEKLSVVCENFVTPSSFCSGERRRFGLNDNSFRERADWQEAKGNLTQARVPEYRKQEHATNKFVARPQAASNWRGGGFSGGSMTRPFNAHSNMATRGSQRFNFQGGRGRAPDKLANTHRVSVHNVTDVCKFQSGAVDGASKGLEFCEADITDDIVCDQNNDCKNVVLDDVMHVSIIVNGSPIVAIVDSGAQITVINPAKLSVRPYHSQRSIILKPALGMCVKADLANVCLKWPDSINDEKVFATVALANGLHEDCLLTVKDYEQLLTLKSKANVCAITRSQDIANCDSGNYIAMDNCASNDVNNMHVVECKTGDRENVMNDSIVDTDSANDKVLNKSIVVDCSNSGGGELVKTSEVNTSVIFKEANVKAEVFVFRDKQRCDKTLSHIFLRLDSLKDSGNDYCGYFMNVVDNLLYRRTVINSTEVVQLIVPVGKREQILQLAHNSVWAGHMAGEKTYDRIKFSFFWPGMRNDVERYCKACQDCQLRARKTVFDRVPIEPVIREGKTFEQMSVDCLGPILKSGRGHEFVLVAVDSHSKWVEAVPLKRINAQSICKALLEIFARTSIPKVIVADNAGCFSSKLTEEFHKMIGVAPRFSTPLHPQGNGLAERNVGNFKNCLHHVIMKYGTNWDQQIPFVLWALREMVNATTRVSPMLLVYGQQGRGPLSLLKNMWAGESEYSSIIPKSISQYLSELKDRLANAASIAENNAVKNQAAYTQNYNKRAVAKHFIAGDKVVVFERDSTHKILARWTGPCEIMYPVSNNSYMVLMPNQAHRLLHANHIKKFIESECVNDNECESKDSKDVASVNDSSLFNSKMRVKQSTSNLCSIGVIEDVSTKDFGDIVVTPILTSGSDTDFDTVLDEQCAHLTVLQRKQLEDVLRKHASVFSDVPGLCRVGEHSIRVRQGMPIPKRKLYPIPMCYREEVDRQVKDLLEMDIIEHSNSEYAHPVVCVKKKTGDIRMAVDYKGGVNAVSLDDRYPMINANELLYTVGAAQYISCFDCTQGFYQIPLADDGSRDRSAFVTHNGLYNFKRMSFGLKGASETYQRVMNTILQEDKEYANAFIDDVAVYSGTWEMHLGHVDTVLQRLQDAGITLKLSKCTFARPKVKYLGHIIGSGVHAPDPEKLKAVADLVFPKTKRQMKSLLGLISYYRAYVQNMSDLVGCLTEMTKKDKPNSLNPGIREWEAFESVKQKLMSAPILRCPDYSKQFVIQADASKYAVGSCLVQVFDGEEHPIAYASSKLTGSQLAWSTVEKEAYSIVVALKKFDAYVYGREVVLVTDHNPLCYLTNAAPSNPKLTRWKLGLQRYNIVSIVHRKGAEHVNCDALSRLFTNSEDDND